MIGVGPTTLFPKVYYQYLQVFHLKEELNSQRLLEANERRKKEESDR
jgi:hypothetical protein